MKTTTQNKHIASTRLAPFNFNSAKEMSISRLAKAYQKLKPFLRAVPAHRDREYGLIPSDACVYDEIMAGSRNNGESPTGTEFNISQVYEYEAYLLWMPGDKKFKKPTFDQFISAYRRKV